MGATFETGKIFFSVKWKDSDLTDIVTASEANLRIPQLVIQFYEERVDWGDEEEPPMPQEQPPPKTIVDSPSFASPLNIQ